MILRLLPSLRLDISCCMRCHPRADVFSRQMREVSGPSKTAGLTTRNVLFFLALVTLPQSTGRLPWLHTDYTLTTRSGLFLVENHDIPLALSNVEVTNRTYEVVWQTTSPARCPLPGPT